MGQLSDQQQRMAQDIAEAMKRDMEGATILLTVAGTWGDEMKLLEASKFQEALEIIDDSINTIENYLTNYPRMKDVMAFILAREYLNKGVCIGGIGFHDKNVSVVQQGLQWMDKALNTTQWPPEAGSIALNVRKALVNDIRNMKDPVPQSSNASGKEGCASVVAMLFFLPMLFALVWGLKPL